MSCDIARCSSSRRATARVEINSTGPTTTTRPIVEAAAKLRCRSAVIDGEVVAVDDAGCSDFHAIKTAIALGGRGLVFIAFDLVFLNSADLRAVPVEEHRAALRGVIPRSPKSRLQFSEDIAGDGAKVFASAEQRAGSRVIRHDQVMTKGIVHRTPFGARGISH